MIHLCSRVISFLVLVTWCQVYLPEFTCAISGHNQVKFIVHTWSHVTHIIINIHWSCEIFFFPPRFWTSSAHLPEDTSHTLLCSSLYHSLTWPPIAQGTRKTLIKTFLCPGTQVVNELPLAVFKPSLPANSSLTGFQLQSIFRYLWIRTSANAVNINVQSHNQRRRINKSKQPLGI